MELKGRFLRNRVLLSLENKRNARLSNNIQLTHQEISFKNKQFPLCILADGLTLARNIGSLFRVADAFGVEHIYLNDSAESLSDLKIRKAARATHKTVKYSYIEKSAIETIQTLKQSGYTIISLEITSNSENLREFVQTHAEKGALKKVCLVIGSENKGISQVLLDSSDHTVHIPMQGQNSSMNVVIACSIALYELSNCIR